MPHRIQATSPFVAPHCAAMTVLMTIQSGPCESLRLQLDLKSPWLRDFNLEAMASNLLAMASNLLAMASNLLEMASNILQPTSNLIPMGSNLLAMAHGLKPTSDSLQPARDGLQHPPTY